MNLQLIGFLLLVSYVVARPASYDEYLAVEDDAATVGSMRREVRAPVPLGFATEVKDLLSSGTEPRRLRQATKGGEEPKKTSMKNASGKSDEGGYYKTYGSDAEGEKGYLKQTYSKGNQGYKTLDTFHKQDGDNYGYEKHTAFGKAKGAEEGGKHGKSGSYQSHDVNHGDDHEGAGTIVDTHYVPVSSDHAGYTEGEHYSEGDVSGGDVGYYAGGDDSGHYSDGGDGGHYTSAGEGSSGSYSTGSSSGEQYSSGGGDEGSHGTHGSYSSGDDSGDHQAYDEGGYDY